MLPKMSINFMAAIRVESGHLFIGARAAVSMGLSDEIGRREELLKNCCPYMLISALACRTGLMKFGEHATLHSVTPRRSLDGFSETSLGFCIAGSFGQCR